MKNAIKLFSLLLCFSLVSCEEKNLEGHYKVMEVSNNDMSNSGATIIIAKDEVWRISGNNSCNTYGAKVTYDGSNYIEIGPIMSTKMYCEEKRESERLFMTQLAKVKSYRFSKGQLHLMNEAGDIVIKADRTEENKEK